MTLQKMLSHFFAASGVEDVTIAPAIRALFPPRDHELRDYRGLGRRLGCHADLVSPHPFAPVTLTIFQERTDTWEFYAHAHAIDPLRPTPFQLAAFLTLQATNANYRHVGSYISALRAYFFSAGVPDVASTRMIRELYHGVRHEQPSIPPPTYSREIVRRVVHDLPNTPSGVRARIIILLCRMRVPERVMLQIRIENITIDADVTITHGSRQWLAHSETDEEFSLHVWLARWFAILGRSSGVLLPPIERNGAVSPNGERAVSRSAIAAVLERSFSRYGLDVPYLPQAIRRGVITDSLNAYGPVRTAHRFGFKTVWSLVPYSPAVLRKINEIRGRHSNVRRARWRRRNLEA